MSEDKTISDIITDTNIETSTETNTETNTEPDVNTAKTKKLAQLAAARQSAQLKKRKREQDMSSMSERLDKLTSLLLTKDTKQEHGDDDEEEPPKVKRPKRVTTATVTHEAEDSWTTSMIRTGALVSLAGMSYWFQNFYGASKSSTVPRQKKKIESKPHIIKPVQFNNSSSTAVGMSGFTV
jgi:hypothetical protein